MGWGGAEAHLQVLEKGVKADMDVGKNMNVKLMARMCKGSTVDY